MTMRIRAAAVGVAVLLAGACAPYEPQSWQEEAALTCEEAVDWDVARFGPVEVIEDGENKRIYPFLRQDQGWILVYGVLAVGDNPWDREYVLDRVVCDGDSPY